MYLFKDIGVPTKDITFAVLGQKMYHLRVQGVPKEVPSRVQDVLPWAQAVIY